jgi:hypothetical protein
MTAAAHAAPPSAPTGFKCPVAPTAERIELAWDPANRDEKIDTPAYRFRLSVSGAKIPENPLDASSYVLTPAHFGKRGIPVGQVNVEATLRRVYPDGKAQAFSRMNIFIPKQQGQKCPRCGEKKFC